MAEPINWGGWPAGPWTTGRFNDVKPGAIREEIKWVIFPEEGAATTVAIADDKRVAQAIALLPQLVAALGNMAVVFEGLVPVASKHACYREAMALLDQIESNRDPSEIEPE